MAEKQLTPETQGAIRAAVERMTVEHGLLEETQQELAAHLEDKTLAYVSGEQAVTEADALLLARHHLGDAKLLGSRLAKAALKRRFIPTPMIERLMIACASLFVAVGIARICYCYIYLPWLVLGPYRHAVASKDVFYIGGLNEAEIATLPTTALAFAFALFVLARVVPRMKLRRMSVYICFTAFLFAVFAAGLPGKYADPTLFYGRPIQIAQTVNQLHTLHLASWLLIPLVTLIVWIRFTCQKLITWRTVGLAFIVYFVAANVLQVIQHVMTKFEDYAMVSRSESLAQWIIPNTLQMTGLFAAYGATAQVPLVLLILLAAKAVQAYRNRAADATLTAL